TGVRVKVDNDANCFALGEYFRWKMDLVGITIGTGLGGGIIINGNIYHGKRDAGEFGHMTVVLNGRKCTCGNRGCLEEYVSIRAFRRETKRFFGKRMDPKEVYLLARSGDKKAKQIFERVGKFLGVGLANIANVLNPELIVIGGGISEAGKFLLDPARREMEKRLMVSKPRVVLGKQYSAAFGAVMLWR
ncbi:MAG TPA: ROK family protein, partial [Thermoplasmata archaeon]|nr:ROK family protein [Thermoplasmata archaeon]